MSQSARDELLEMLARHAFIERKLTLASGKTSDYYLDCKRALYLPKGAYLAGEVMLDLVLQAKIEQLGGMAAGALPVTDAIVNAAYRRKTDLRGFFVRKETKAHGMQQRVEGAFQAGLRTAVIDDTVTTGGSSLDAVAAMREAGANVIAALALVDRSEGGREAFARAGLEYHHAFTADEIRRAR